MKRHLCFITATFIVNFFVISNGFTADKLIFSTFENAGITLVEEPVMREVYKRLGYEIEVRQLPGDRAIKSSDKGLFDGELGRLAVIQKITDNLIMIPTPIHEIKEAIFTKNADFIPDGWESLKPFSAVSLRGYKYTERKLIEHGIRHTLVSKFEQVLNTVKAGRHDIGLLIMLDGMKVMKDKGIKGLRILEPAVEKFPIYHFLHKKNKNLVSPVSEKLQELKEEGIIQKIENRIISGLKAE